MDEQRGIVYMPVGGPVTKLARNANANPISFRVKSGKQDVAIVATDTLRVFELP